MRIALLALLLVGCQFNIPWSSAPQPMPPTGPDHLPLITPERALAFANLALAGITREFPNKPGEVQSSPADAKTPRAMHPAFYGSFDWHSAVHGHWMLIRLLRTQTQLPTEIQDHIRATLHRHLSQKNLQAEAHYFSLKQNRSFERMYGWAWYLRLCQELEEWTDDDAKQWRAATRPLENLLEQRILDYLPKLTWPNRVGVHQDTSFALGMIADWAKATQRTEVFDLIQSRALDWYGQDTQWPAAYEPSGEDFFSAGLNEADLMRRILPQAEYAAWLSLFLPGLKNGTTPNLLNPVTVSDVTDGKIVHLAGLNLSRAWCLLGIAHALSPGDKRIEVLQRAAYRHAEAGLDYVFSGHYAGEHWLASFAVFLLS